MKTRNNLRVLFSRSRLLSIIYHIYLCLRGRGRFIFMNEIYFSGWGMTTGTRTPWEDGGGHNITQAFCGANIQLKKLVKEKKFNLSQFPDIDINTDKTLDQFNWRHYVVYWSSVLAIKNTQSTQNNFVECGVCDGLTLFYALSAAKSMNKPFQAYLCDAWDSMKEDYLIGTEKSQAGRYAFLNVESTKDNLSMFGSDVMVFNKGYIPDVFQVAKNPESLIWMHIDLNSALPTVHALKFFWDKLEEGGVILFDDYAWSAHQNTKKSIEEWSADKNGILFHLPTGQGLFIKNRSC